ncbi:MAG: outer membrane beta-barrel protein [Hyphomonadaceae bacterium]|nr:outer membrane beta-barrel protein [Hyphomonadaceae bacterium]
MLGRMMASALALTGAAYAEDSPSGGLPTTPPSVTSGRVAYEAGFFAQFNPQNALDMVRQTPGFSLDGGDDRRGFSGAVGNLLIDGLRPSTKSQSLEGILSRIPASQVVRVELLRGAEVAGDASGQSQLLNVVRTPSAGSGLWEASFEAFENNIAPRGEASYSGRSGQVEYGFGASFYTQERALPGWRELSDSAGALTETVETPSPRNFREATLNGNVAFPLAGGRVSATAQVDANKFRADNSYLFFDPSGTPTRSFFNASIERGESFELGVNYDRDFGPWSLALIGLINRGVYENEEAGRFEDGYGGVDATYRQDVTQETSETILRGSIARPLGARHRIEFGGEGAFNSLDQSLAFVEDGAPLFIPNSNVLIEEERAEFFASHNWRPADAWSVETRVAWETSTLTFTGDDNQTVDLAFWKPSIQVSRTFAGDNQLRFRVYRDVGQLDFGDFVSAASVSDDLISGGNTDLVPQTDWRAELGADLRFPGGVALGLTLTQHNYRDVADLVQLVFPNPDEDPLDPDDDFIRFDAPGNIGDANALSLDVNLSTPVAFIPGGRLTVEGSLWDTEVTDPVTNQPRIFSFRSESEISIEFRQDLSDRKLAWGISATKEGEFQAYRFNEIDTSEEGPWVDLWVETTALPNNMRLRLWALNVLDGTINRNRRFFGAPGDGDPNNDDRTGPYFGRDLRERQFSTAPWFLAQLSGRF